MQEGQRLLVAALLAACEGHPHAKVLRRALVWGFPLVEEKETTWYAPASTAEEVAQLLPKAQAYVEQLEVEFAGGSVRNKQTAEPPVGLTEEELAHIQWLSSAPVPGKMRPPTNGDDAAGNGEPADLLMEEEALKRIKRLSR